MQSHWLPYLQDGLTKIEPLLIAIAVTAFVVVVAFVLFALFFTLIVFLGPADAFDVSLDQNAPNTHSKKDIGNK